MNTEFSDSLIAEIDSAISAAQAEHPEHFNQPDADLYRLEIAENVLKQVPLLDIYNIVREGDGLPPVSASECSPGNCNGCQMHVDSACERHLHWPDGTPPEPPCFEFSDELVALREHADEMRALYGNDDVLTIVAIANAMAALPPFLKRKMDESMAEAGFVKPKPCGFSDDGEPLFSLADVAAMVGVSESEAIERAREMDDELAAHGITPGTYTGNVHAVQ
jgi:hypothetical protein